MKTLGGAGTGFGGAAFTATGCGVGGGVGAAGSGGGRTIFGLIAIGGGGGADVFPGPVVVICSRTVPHGCSTLPPRTVIGTDAVSPPVVTLTVVVPALNAHNRPDVALAIGLPFEPCKGLRRFNEFGSCSTKLAMSGRDDANV